jgi:hypothetical protein
MSRGRGPQAERAGSVRSDRRPSRRARPARCQFRGWHAIEEYLTNHPELLQSSPPPETLDERLHRHPAQHGGKLELAVFRFSYAGAKLGPGFGRARR